VGAGGADEIDARLHAERLDSRERRLHRLAYDELPDGAFVLADGQPRLVAGDRLLAWSPGGYGEPRPRPSGAATAITPPTLLAVLRSGWDGLVPLLHPTALSAGAAGATTGSAPRH
jgi:hypothetical protein